MTPKGVINSAYVNSEQRQCDAEQIIRQKAVVVGLGAAAEDVVKGRQAHADLEAHEQSADDQLVHEVSVDFQEGDVVDGKCDE